MNEQAIRDSYELFKTGGYSKSYEEFVTLINSNPQALEDSYTLFKTGGYTKGMEEYEVLMGVKKKDELTESISEDGFLDSSEEAPEPLFPSPEQQAIKDEETLKLIQQGLIADDAGPFERASTQAPLTDVRGQQWDGVPFDAEAQKIKEDKRKVEDAALAERDAMEKQAQDLELLFTRSKREKALKETEDAMAQAMRAREMRDSQRWNEDGTHSTVKFMSYEEDGVHKVVPTLFPKSTVQRSSPRAEDWLELDMDEAIAEAERRNEVFTFDSQEEAEAFAKGSWKTVNTLDLEAQKYYNEYGRDYLSDRQVYDKYLKAKETRMFLEEELAIQQNTLFGDEGQYDDLTPKEQEAYGMYFREDGSLRGDAQEIIDTLDEEEAKLWKTIDSENYMEVQDNFDTYLEKKHRALAQQAANVNYEAKAIEKGLNNLVLNEFGVTLDQLNTYQPANEAQEIRLNEIVEIQNSLERKKELAAFQYETALTYFDAKANKDIGVEFADNLKGWWIAVSDAFENGRAGNVILNSAMGLYGEEAEDMNRAAEEMTDYLNGVDGRQSRAMSRFNTAEEGFSREVRSALRRDPAEVILTWAGASLAQILPYGWKIGGAAVIAGTGGGAITGSIVPGIGTLVGAASGFGYGVRAGYATTNLVLEYTNGVLDAGRELGYNMNNPEEAGEALQDAAVWELGRERGLKRGVPIALMDFLMMGLAGKVFKPVAVASRAKKVGAFAAEAVALDAPFEATGELLAQLNVGDEISVKEIIAEAGGSIGMATPFAALNIYQNTRGNYNQRIAENLMNMKLMASERASDTQIQSWSNRMLKLGKISPEQNQRILENLGLRKEAQEILDITGPSRLGINKKVQTRLMELLDIRAGLDATTNSRSIFSEELAAVNKEIAEIGRTNKLSESPVESINFDFGTIGKRTTVPSYRIGNTMYSKTEFLNYIENLSLRKAHKLMKDSEVVNDEETSILLEEKLEPFAPEEAIQTTEDAIQESSTTEVDVQEQATDGEAVGEGDVITETTEEITPEDEVTETEEVEEETIEVVDKGTKEDVKAFREGTLEAKRKKALLAGIAQRINDGKKLTKFQKEISEDNDFEIAELQGQLIEQEKLMSEARDLEESLGADTSVKKPTPTKKGNISINKEGKYTFTPKGKVRRNKVVVAARKAAKAIKKILPKTRILLHESNEEYLKAVGRAGRAEYLPTENVIHVNLSSATESTMAHEIFHAVFLNSVKTDARAAKAAEKMMLSVRKSLKKNSALAKKIDAFAAKYTGDQAQFQNEERLAELIGILASSKDYKQLSKPAKNAIIEFFKDLALRFGIELGTDFGKTDESVIDLMNTIARKTREGREIEESDVEALNEILPKDLTPEEYIKKQTEGRQQKVISDVLDVNELEVVSKGGSSRIVYMHPDGKNVIKVAKTPKGLEQNISLGFGDVNYLGSFVPELEEQGLDYIIIENVPRNDTEVNKFLKPLKEFTPQDFKNKTAELQDAMRALGLEGFMDYNILWNDFTATRNWGMRENGEFVLVDEGALDDSIHNTSAVKDWSKEEWGEVLSRRRENKKKPAPRQQKATEESKPMSRQQKEGSSYFSNALKAIDNIEDTNPKQPTQWIKALTNTQKNGGIGGVKLELDWIGLEDYLNTWQKENKSKSIPKEIVEQYINDNRIEIVDVQKTDVANIRWKEDALGDLQSQGFGYQIRESQWGFELYRRSEFLETFDTLEEAKQRAIDFENEEVADKEGGVKYSRYTLEGGENYQEVLLTLPTGEFEVMDSEDKVIKSFNTQEEAQDYIDNNEEANGWQRKGFGLAEEGGAIDYKSPHWDEANILSHIRWNERTLPNGEKVLFIEELQSDWAQEGKREGFKEDKKSPKLKGNDVIIDDQKVGTIKETPFEIWMGPTVLRHMKDNPEKRQLYIDEYNRSPTYIAENDERGSRMTYNSKERALESFEQQGSNTPNMPYKKTDQWVGLSIRRMMKMAADNGFDRVAWITGEQSADRYDLSKQISTIRLVDRKKKYPNFYSNKSLNHSSSLINSAWDSIISRMDTNKPYSLYAYDKEGNIVIEEGVEENEIENYVGKEVAKKLLSEETKKTQLDIGVKYDSIDEATRKDFGKRIYYKNKIVGYVKESKDNKDEVYVALNETGERFPVSKSELFDGIAAPYENIVEGEDLQVGGEGMKTFYNSILPKVAKAEAKRFDKSAKIEVIDFRGKTERKTAEALGKDAIPREPNRENKQLSIAITPKMKEELEGPVGVSRQQKDDRIAVTSRKARLYGMNDQGFFPPHIHMEQVRRMFGPMGYDVLKSKTNKSGGGGGVYLQYNGVKFTPLAYGRRQQKEEVMPPSPEDSMVEVITRGRAEGYSEASIREVLKSRGHKVKDIKRVMASTIDSFSDVRVPFEFGNIVGGMPAGIRLFQQIQSEIDTFKAPTVKRTGVRMTPFERAARLNELREANPTLSEISDTALLRRFPRRGVQAETVVTEKTPAEVREKALQILRDNPVYQEQSEQVQMELVIAMDRALGITANRSVAKEIAAIRNSITQRNRKGRELQAIKRELRNLIRTHIPTSKDYSQAAINRLVRATAAVTEDNYRVQVEKVLQVIEKQRENMREKVLKKLLTDVTRGARKTITDTKKNRAGSLDIQGQSFAEVFKKALTLAMASEKQQEKAMEEFRLLAEELETDEGIVALAKSASGETLTSKEERLVNIAVALDLVKNLPSMSLEEVQNLANDYAVAASMSRQELSATRKRRALETDALRQKVTDALRRSNPELFHEDGTLIKDLNERRALLDAVRDYWVEGKGKGLSARLKGQVKAAKAYWEIFDWKDGPQMVKSMFDSLKHLGTFMNSLNDTLYEEVFNRLNRMDNNSLQGYFKQQDFLRSLGYEAVLEQLFDTKLYKVEGIRSTVSGEKRNESFSKDQLLRLYALSLNPIQNRKLEAMGFTREKMIKIEEYLGKDVTGFADKVVAYLSNEYYEGVNDVYRDVNDVNLNYVENYFPTMTTQADVNPKQLFDGDFNGIFNAESAPALRNRNDMTSDINLKGASFTSALESHIKTMEHYKAYAADTKKLNAIFNTNSVDGVLTVLGMKKMVKQSVNNAVNPDSGKNALNSSGKIFSALQTKFTAFALAFRLVQIGKQMTSFINAFENYSFRKSGKQSVFIDIIPFLMDYAAVMAQPRKYLKMATEMSPTFRYRLAQGVKGDLAGLESGSPTLTALENRQTVWGKFWRGFKKGGAAPTIVGDIMGVMGYMANYRRNIKNGMSKEKAVEAFNEYNQTQQTRRPSERAIIQQNSNFIVRGFTMFGSTPILYINNVMQASTNILRGFMRGGVKGINQKDVRRLVLNLGAANAAFVAMSNLGLLLRGDDEERKEAMRQIRNAMLGANLVYMTPFVGSTVKGIENYMTGNRRPTDMGVNPFVSLFNKWKKAAKDDKEMEAMLQLVIEIGIGAQLAPFIALINTAGNLDEAGIEEIYDMIGYSESYREKTAKKGYKPFTPKYQRKLDREQREKERKESNPAYIRRKEREKKRREEKREKEKYGN